MARLLPAVLVLVCACDGGAAADAATDAPSACVSPEPFEAATAEGADPLAALAGEARAGRIDASALPADPAGLATWRPGDFALANDRIAVVISDAESPREAYDPYGGRLVGIARVEGGALVEPADFNVLLLGVGRFLVATDAVGVVKDGQDGGPAVIRARGPLAPIGALADLLDGLLPEDFEGLPGALEYELAPDAEHVDVFVLVRAGPAGVRARLGIAQAFFQQFRMPTWSPGAGFGARSGAPRHLAFADDDATSFAWMAPEGELALLFGQQGIDLFTSDRLSVGPCAEARVHVGRLVIGGPGLAPLQAAVARLDGTETRPIAGRVLEADGTPARGVRVHVTAADGEHLSRMDAADDGAFAFEVDARAVELWAWRGGAPPAGPLAVGDDVTITMPASARVDVTVVDSSGAPLPVRVEVLPEVPPEPAPASWGEAGLGRGRSHVAFAMDGRATLRVAPGRHRVTVSRGPEYELVEVPIELAAGEVSTQTLSLERVVDTRGVMCADYHIHTHRSVDSSDPGVLKLTGLVADGLEIAIRSEHEWVSDFTPIIDALGLGDRVLGMAGLELTTFTFGHFGVFPLVPDERPSGGAVRWYGRLAPEVFDEVRARPEAPALIINHPRAGGIRQAYFSEAGYDPDTGTVGRPELWDEGFSVVEVFNSSDFERNRGGAVRDWFSFLNAGRRVFAVGSSDSHRIHETPVGYPRTCLVLGVDDVAALTPRMVRDATLAGRSTVSGGIFLDVLGPGGAGPGQEASGVGPSARLDVVVRAATHVSVDRLEVIVDGVTVETMEILEGDGDPLETSIRARAAIDVDVAPGGSWVVLHASGAPGFDSHGHTPFAVSNPVFLRP